MPAKKVVCSKVGFCIYTVVWIAAILGTVLFFLIHSSKLCFEEVEEVIQEYYTWDNYRLPKDIQPVHYDLSVSPELYQENDAHFSGNITCKFLVGRDTKLVIFHSKHLNISDVKIQELDVRDRVAKDVELERHFEYKKTEFYVVEVRENLVQGKYYNLDVDFNGRLDGAIVGFYKMKYKDTKTNTTRYIAATKFEPTDARKAFPCFDEPQMKATWSVQIKHHKDYQALSNMPVKESRPLRGGYMLTTFEKSVPMSTYLVAYIVGQFAELKAKTKRGTPFRVLTTPDKADQGKYALRLGTSMLDFYEDLFGIQYSLPKMDMIGIPVFISGAMEHWGLLTYREIYLLYDAGEASIMNRFRVASIIAHEMVHQWFGNIVTMDWWDDIWLNEGFASYFEYKALQGTENLPDMSSQFLTLDMYSAMTVDGMQSSHPIVVPVTKRESILEAFDSISYKKGASILRMLENVIGEQDFVSGIHKYLQKYQYRNARTEELWTTLQQATNSELDLTNFLNTWTRQMGFPVVTVSHVGGGQIKLTQERFLRQDARYNESESPYRYLWDIPINYTTSAGNSKLVWLRKKEMTIDVGLDLSYYRNWVKLNAGQMGYYIVDYPDDWWARFSDLLVEAADTFPVVDRLGLVHDAEMLAESGRLSYPNMLDLFRYLQGESNFYPWSEAMSGIKQISYRLRDSPTYEKWRLYVLSLVDQVYSRIEWDVETEDANKKQLRIQILEAACYHDHQSCLERVSRWLRRWAFEQKRIDPNYRDQVYAYGLSSRENVSEIWDKMWSIYQKEGNPQEKKKLLFGLAGARDQTHIKRLLEYSLQPDMVPVQNVPRLLTALGRSRYNKDVIWTWLDNNFQKVVDRLGKGNVRLWRIIPWIGRGFSTEKQLEKVEAFFVKHPVSARGPSAVMRMREKIGANIAWLQQFEGEIHEWLDREIRDDVHTYRSNNYW